jgi:tRNA uridine 5-carboxymethylaminomethyl modification enzyme
MAALADAHRMARSVTVTSREAERHGLALKRDGHRRTAFELLAYPTIGFADVCAVWPEFGALEPTIAEQLEIDAKYAVYLDRQAADVAAYRRDENLALPAALDYDGLPGLSTEVRQKLGSIRPRTLGQAGRIDGVTPAALTLLAAHIRRKGRPREPRQQARKV